MKIMSPPHLLSLCALLSLFAPGARGALGARQPAAEAARAELLRRLNEERRAAGAPPLVLQPQLTAAAQEHAEELSRRGDISNRRGASEEMDERLHRLGYRAAEWGEGVYATTEDIGAVVSGLRERDGDTWRRLMDPGYRDVGIGVSELRDMALYTVLVALPEAELFARRTAGLRDLSRVRAEMLEAVAEVRRKAGLQPLTPDPRLDRAAQGHAEDMLARSYFAHQSPEGKTVRQRATEAGYPWRMIGENIAEGQYTVAEVMDSWMKSRPHRANLLERGFTQLGTGLAFGRDPKTGDYRTVWVQVFGTPK
jgi:uncharacterized protein YkwD